MQYLVSWARVVYLERDKLVEDREQHDNLRAPHNCVVGLDVELLLNLYSEQS